MPAIGDIISETFRFASVAGSQDSLVPSTQQGREHRRTARRLAVVHQIHGSGNTSPKVCFLRLGNLTVLVKQTFGYKYEKS